jgi:hypothetical protein
MLLEGGVIGHPVPVAFDIGESIEVEDQCAEGVHVGSDRRIAVPPEPTGTPGLLLCRRHV